MLVSGEDENLILLDCTAAVQRVVMQVDDWGRLIRSQKDGPRARIRGTSDEVELGMRLIRAGVRDDVVNDTRGAAKFRGETVRYSLYFAHINIGNGKQP